MGFKYESAKCSFIKADICGGYTVHTNHVCERLTWAAYETCHRNPKPVRVVYLSLFLNLSNSWKQQIETNYENKFSNVQVVIYILLSSKYLSRNVLDSVTIALDSLSS